MPKVQLLYDDDCPNVELARSNLRQAFALAGLAPSWVEHRIGAADAPVDAHGYGSPTVLIDSADVAGASADTESCCRVYQVGGRMTKAPAAELIAEALRNSTALRSRR